MPRISLILIILVMNLKLIMLKIDHPQELSANTFQPSKQSICPQLKFCNCRRDGSYVMVDCIHLKNFTELMSEVRKKFSHRPIGHIYISHSSLDYLPAQAFANLTITKIFIRKSSIGWVDNQVFSGVRGLVQLKFDNMKYVNFPISILCVNATLRYLTMDSGQLRVIDRQLTDFRLMRFLSFKHNQIRTIDPQAFLRMTELIYLDLSNNSIKTLHPRTLASLQSLRHLDLTKNGVESVNGLLHNRLFIENLMLQGNNIKNIDNLTDGPLYSLKALYLAGNPLQVITKDSFGINFPQLRILHLNQTQLSSLDSSAFQYMISLQQLMLIDNKLSLLDQNVFANIESLEFISLASNGIKTIKNLFTHNKGLTTLFLSYNYIDDIQECFHSNSLLTSLYLDHNQLQRIYSYTFKNNKKLVKLSLDNNKIEYLERDSFYGLISLKTLYISHNKIDNLNHSLNNLPQLREVYLQDNRLVSLGPSHFQQIAYLEIIDIAYNRLISVEKAFANLPNLENLKINNNFINTLTDESFSSQASLRNLELRKNPWHCDCRMEWLVNTMLRNYLKLDEAICSEPNWLKSRKISTLKLNDVVEWKTNCPHDCHCLCKSNFSDFYIDVDCRNKELAQVPNSFPEKTNSLDLSHNIIVEIPEFLRNFTQLEHLFLDFNNLTTLPDLTSLRLKTLTLSNNRFARFPIKSIKAGYLETISLSENPWICDCQTLPLVKWMLSEKDKIVDVNQTKCGSNNQKFKLQKIVSLTEPLLCPVLIVLYLTVAARVAVILLTMAAGKIIYNKYRMYIRIWFYSRGFSCFKEDDFNEDKQFDAFVSYSSLDESFVLFELVPMLESGEKPYFLCLHSRNFLPGSYIQDNIINAVKASKRTILVLSKNFLSSEWCRLEFKSAHHQVLEERLNRLIVIVLGDLPAHDQIDPEILLYLKTTT